MVTMKNTNVTEILPGILIFKNFFSKIEHNCNKHKIKIVGTFLLKFENCKIQTINKNFTNVNIRSHENFILPNFITKIKEDSNTTLADIKLENLYIEQIKNQQNIKQIMYHNTRSNITNISIDIIIVLMILLLITLYLKTKS